MFVIARRLTQPTLFKRHGVAESTQGKHTLGTISTRKANHMLQVKNVRTQHKHAVKYHLALSINNALLCYDSRNEVTEVI